MILYMMTYRMNLRLRTDKVQDGSETMPVFSIKTNLNSIYPFEEVNDEVE